MGTTVPFTDNVNDLSNLNGYQFEFRCERCGNGYRSGYIRDTMMTGRGLLHSVGDLFGGALQDLGNAADDLVMNRGTNSVAKDRALQKAVEEIAPKFVQCRGCGNWVCREVCWNDSVGQCVTCAPVTADELNRLRAEERTTQLRDHLQSVDLVAGIPVEQDVRPGCPSCGARVSGGKFCPECGAPLATERECAGCHTMNGPTAKFCSECGHALA